MFLLIDLLGLDAKDLEWHQMMTRTVIVFIIALIFIRLSGMRTFGTQSAFDVVVSITLGGILGRCIMGHYPFFPSLGAAGLLVVMHRLISFLSRRSKTVSWWTEGNSVLLFGNGKKNTAKLNQYSITDKELIAAIHEESIDSLEKVKSIWLEPDGKLSVVKKTRG
jgi:uncharacterized membrane protein YcaP (DUF421 family)